MFDSEHTSRVTSVEMSFRMEQLLGSDMIPINHRAFLGTSHSFVGVVTCNKRSDGVGLMGGEVYGYAAEC